MSRDILPDICEATGAARVVSPPKLLTELEADTGDWNTLLLPLEARVDRLYLNKAESSSSAPAFWGVWVRLCYCVVVATVKSFNDSFIGLR